MENYYDRRSQTTICQSRSCLTGNCSAEFGQPKQAIQEIIVHIRILDPIGYFDVITPLTYCQGMFTDSGVVQEETYFPFPLYGTRNADKKVLETLVAS